MNRCVPVVSVLAGIVRFLAGRYEVEPTDEERRRCGGAEQDLIELVDDSASTAAAAAIPPFLNRLFT
jgi:hypothetical protein